MKIRALFFVILFPFFCYSQFNDSFLDGNFINNPFWEGSSNNFFVNNTFQLQSKATTTSTSCLFTTSQAIDNASWECWVKINYSTSSSNYAAIYIVSDRVDITNGCNGYYIQIGNTNDEVSLYLQEGTKKTKIIDGIDKRTDGNSIEIKIKVSRDKEGNFKLYSKLATETDYIQEGLVQNNSVKSSTYFGLVYANTSTTGSAYYFDDIVVSGDKWEDLIPPTFNSVNIIEPNKLKLVFSEAVDFSKAEFNLNPDLGELISKIITDNKTSIELTFGRDFEKGKIYILKADGLSDLSGNKLIDNERQTGIIEPISFEDILFNEIMFENAENSVEYVEFYNNSTKLINLSGLIFTTRKTDGSLNTGVKIQTESQLPPNSYMAICPDASILKKYYALDIDANIFTDDTWPALNNESATVVLCNSTKDTIYDELIYDKNWHHNLIKNPKGVALEKINPSLPSKNPDSWHSAGSDVRFGTPGYQNSQFRELSQKTSNEKILWADPEAFSPDNDGVNDICYIHYKTSSNGFKANAIIFNAAGVKVNQLVTNQLLSNEGYFLWDGKTDSGKNANVGVYVIYFEMFNPENGQREQQKIPVVVSSI